MNFRDVLAFVTVAKLKSFSAAAENLHIAQSALSRRVHRLEQHLGVTLLERHARGVRVTKLGALLLDKAGRLEAELHRIEEDIRATARTQPEEIRVAIPPGAARLFASSVAARYQLSYPHVRLQLFEKQSALNRDSALRGEVDLALVYDAEPSEELSFTPLLFERILVIARASGETDIRVGDTGYDVRDLARLPLILPGLPHAYRRIVENITASHGLTPNITLEVNGFATSLMMVQQGLGFAISTYPPVQAEIEAGRLVGIPITSPSCEVQLSIIHRRDRTLGQPQEALKSVFVEVSRNIEPSPYWRPASG